MHDILQILAVLLAGTIAGAFSMVCVVLVGALARKLQKWGRDGQ